MPNTREKFIGACERELANNGTGREMRFVGGDVVPVIANGVTVQEWIPVTERLPDLELSNAKANDMDLFPCLCFIPHKRAKNGWYITKLWYTGEGFIDGDNVYWDEATHWMPLPQPPKGE